MATKTENMKCNFCNKTAKQVRKLVAGPGVYICDECIELCTEIVEEELGTAKDGQAQKDAPEDTPKPAEIAQSLDEYVIGQGKAKKTLAVSLYNHYKRIGVNGKVDDVELSKSNICLIGPTGSGKTLLAQTLARVMNVPFAMADATSLTEAGYVGEDVENILLKLIQAADYDIEKAQRGIIYIDEIDKITRKSENPSITRDVSGEGVQQGLLKILEGTIASVPPQGGRKHPHQENLQIDTTHILFICGGAFAGIEQIIKRRHNEKVIGFSGAEGKTNAADKNVITKVTHEDLMKYGMIPELLGRLPVIAALEELDEAALVEILTKPKNALVKQYQKLAQIGDEKDLVFTPEALTEIAKQAIARKTGARGLRSIIEKLLLTVMFEMPTKEENEVTITADYVQTADESKIQYRKKETDSQQSA